MSQAVDNNMGQQDGSSLSQSRVFKFHHISKDSFNGGTRRTKKDAPSVKRRLQTHVGESRKLKAQMILNKYIPIKQKTVSGSEVTKNIVEDVSCDTKNQEKSGPMQLTTERKTDDDTNSGESCQENSSEKTAKTGLRLVNIANLLKEPDKEHSSRLEEQHICDLLSLQEAPLDLSRKSPYVSEDSSPLDLSRKSPFNYCDSEKASTYKQKVLLQQNYQVKFYHK